MSLQSNFHTLTTLSSLTSADIERLQRLGISNLGDLLAYPPFRYARLVSAAKDQLLRKEEILNYLDADVHSKSLSEILASPAVSLRGLGAPSANILKRLGIRTIADLANYAPFGEAEEIVTRATSDETDPFAPPCVLPTCRKFTRNSKGYVSFFKQEEIRHLSVAIGKGAPAASLIASLFHFKSSESKLIYLGYSVAYRQDWIYTGIHLGEPQGSVSLFMGQDTQVSVLDWRRVNSALRRENTEVAERLASTLFHQRAVDEVARATAEEHQHGGTSAFGANAATAGSFVAAGAIVGGIGGGISGALTGLVLGNVANAAGGAPTIAGAAVGTAVGSIAGAAAGSLIFAGATTLGFVETDAEGDREIFARSAQNIQQRTIQNSSSIRSFWSNIVSQSVQEEEQRIRTDRVTNHNRIHALNALYFEVLNEYRVNMTAVDFDPILFLPFKPFYFNEAILTRYWWIIRTFIADSALVLALDERFTALNSDPSPAELLAELPLLEDIDATSVEVEVNLDGSAMREMVKTAIFALGGAIGLVTAAVDTLLNMIKRDQVKVKLLTSDGTKNLDRVSSPNSDPNFIGKYKRTRNVPIHTIEAVKIVNDNDEFTIEIPGFGSIDINKLVFEQITAKLKIDNEDFTAALPDIGALEDKQVISERLEVNANRSSEVAWSIAEQLRNQYEGVAARIEELEQEIAEEAAVQVKLQNLLSFLNANKYGFTRLILQSTEREQVIAALEEVEIGGVDLSRIASTTPLGFCGNHVVLPLKKCAAPSGNYDPISIDTSKLELLLRQFETVDLDDMAAVLAYVNSLRSFIDQFLPLIPAGTTSIGERKLREQLQALKLQLDQFVAVVGAIPSGANPIVVQGIIGNLENRLRQAITALLKLITAPAQSNNHEMTRLCEYYSAVRKALADRMGRIISTDEVSLPSPAVFMEPVLSNAKGAELYDMRRNSHYEILPAPGIGAADPNVIRTQDLSLTPTLPPAVLTIQNAPELPLPTSINAALAEAGKLDLSTLINTNAASLNSALSNLANMATELARASAQLTGDAQKQALDSASQVAKQIGEIAEKALQAPQAPAAPAPKPPAPQTQQEKAEVKREAERINKGTGTQKEKKELKETIGAIVTPDGQHDYQMSIIFLDADGIPYANGEFTLVMSFFELGSQVAINGGAPIPFSEGEFFFPETFRLTAGRKITLSISATLSGATITGIANVNLPNRPDVSFRARIKTKPPEKHREVNVKNTMDQKIENDSFRVALAPMFESFLNAGVKFPFEIFEISGDTGRKTKLDLAFEYKNDESTTDTDSTSETTEREFEVVLPMNGWDITTD